MTEDNFIEAMTKPEGHISYLSWYNAHWSLRDEMNDKFASISDKPPERILFIVGDAEEILPLNRSWNSEKKPIVINRSWNSELQKNDCDQPILEFWAPFSEILKSGNPRIQESGNPGVQILTTLKIEDTILFDFINQAFVLFSPDLICSSPFDIRLYKFRLRF